MPARIARRHASYQRRRIPTWTAVALMLLIASSTPSSTRTGTSVVRAFVLPKLRVRSNHHNTMAIRSTPDKTKASLDAGNDDKDDDKKRNGKKEIKAANGNKDPRNGTSKPPPPGSPLSMLCDEAAEVEDSFEIHVGRALDTLRKDYPHMLTDKPDFSIFDQSIEVIDPTGVKLHGIKAYKNAFRLIHGIVQVFYCPERSGLTFRLCYDTARQSIRVSWNAEVIPKAIFGGVRTTLHVDGISVYEISQSTGMITQHRIERLIMNDTPVQPKQGIFALLRNEHDESVPVFNSMQADEPPPTPGFGNALEFRAQQTSQLFHEESTALAAVSAGDDSEANSNQDNAYPGLDWEALERKNASRKKFGLDPMTPEEFLENEAVVQQMESQQRQRAASASAAAEMTKQGKSRQQGFLERLFGDIIPEACESNFDCVRPEICCDFGFKKICCASGTMVGNTLMEPALVPVPADVHQRGELPPNNNNNNNY